MSVKWTVNPGFERKLTDLIEKRLNAVGEFLSETLFEELSRNYYPSRIASYPGEYPKMRTETLRNSVLPHGFDSQKMEIVVGPGTWVPYVTPLVTMDRKFAYSTLEENIDEVVRIFREGK